MDKRTSKSFRTENGADGLRIISVTTLPVGAELELTYTIVKDGRIKVDMDYRPTSSNNIPLIPKLGMRMRLPAAMTPCITGASVVNGMQRKLPASWISVP